VAASMMQLHRKRDSRAAVRMPLTLRRLARGAGFSGADQGDVSADIKLWPGEGAKAEIGVRGDATGSVLKRHAGKRKGPSAGDSGGARGYPVVEAE